MTARPRGLAGPDYRSALAARKNDP
jgi:hypothetical protein